MGVVIESLYNGEVILSFDEENHTYTWLNINPTKYPSGLPVPGVTGPLGRCLAKNALPPWASKMNYEHVRGALQDHMVVDDLGARQLRISEKELEEILLDGKDAHKTKSKVARDIGSLVHKFAEEWLIHGVADMPSDPNAQNGCRAFLSWIQDPNIKVISAERFVLSRKYYYAGKTDLLAIINDQMAVVDFKASTGFWVPEYPYQLAAYAVALEEELGETIDNGWIVRLDKQTGVVQPMHYWLYSDPVHEVGAKYGWIDLLRSYRSILKTEEMYNARRTKAA